MQQQQHILWPLSGTTLVSRYRQMGLLGTLFDDFAGYFLSVHNKMLLHILLL